MKSILENICKIDSICGYEQKLTEFIISKLPSECSFKIDNLDNLVVKKSNNHKSKNKIVLISTIDEVGLIVNDIENDGSLRFLTIGKINPDSLVGSVIKINNIVGVIGQKPPHKQSKNERNNSPSINNLFIDIGCDSKKEAAEKIKLGDIATFKTDFFIYGNDRISSKSINNKIGCGVLLKLLLDSVNCDFFCAFISKSNATCSGATTIANLIEPDIAIILDCFEENFEQNKTNNNFNFILNPATNKKLFDSAINLAKNQQFQFNINVCNKPKNITNFLTQSKSSIKTLEISIPCRLINSNLASCCFFDLNQTLSFLKKLVILFSNS